MQPSDYFNLVADHYDERLARNWWWRYIKRREIKAVESAFIGKVAGRNILDLGSGTGLAAKQIEFLGGRVVCVDIASKMNCVARAKGLQVIESSIENLRLEEKFDSVMALGSFEFVSCLESSFATVSYHLKEGGFFVLLYPRGGVVGVCYEKIHQRWGCQSKIRKHEELLILAQSKGLYFQRRESITLMSELLIFKK